MFGRKKRTIQQIRDEVAEARDLAMSLRDVALEHLLVLPFSNQTGVSL